jgi:hypothetical protein
MDREPLPEGAPFIRVGVNVAIVVAGVVLLLDGGVAAGPSWAPCLLVALISSVDGIWLAHDLSPRQRTRNTRSPLRPMVVVGFFLAGVTIAVVEQRLFLALYPHGPFWARACGVAALTALLVFAFRGAMWQPETSA